MARRRGEEGIVCCKVVGRYCGNVLKVVAAAGKSPVWAGEGVGNLEVYTRIEPRRSACGRDKTSVVGEKGRKWKGKGEREICVGKSNNGESDWSEKRQVEMGKDSSEEERYLFLGKVL